MPTAITSSGITFDDTTTQTTSATKAGGIGTTQLADAAVTAAKLDGVAKNGAGTNVAVGDPPVFGCRAWVNFDGTKDTTGAASTANTNRLIRASGNVTSVARNGLGGYLITFTTAMPDANYAVASSAFWSGGPYFAGPTNTVSLSAGTLQIQTGSTAAGTSADVGLVSVAIFR